METMAITDSYVKKPTVFNIILFTGDNVEEVRQFFSDRGCTQFVQSRTGVDLNGSYDGTPPTVVDVDYYIVLNMTTLRVQESIESIETYELKS